MIDKTDAIRGPRLVRGQGSAIEIGPLVHTQFVGDDLGQRATGCQGAETTAAMTDQDVGRGIRVDARHQHRTGGARGGLAYR